MTKEINLVNSEERALVDDEDYEFINQFIWWLEDGYAVTYDNDGKPVEMGWLVLQRANARNN
jgi:hypothetical protein